MRPDAWLPLMDHPYIFSILIGYLLGSLSLADLFGRLAGVDLRARNTKSLGASNAAITLGKARGAAVAVHDIAKAAIAIALARTFFPDEALAAFAASSAAILGHIFPPALRFRGGKGFACVIGSVLAAAPILAPFLILPSILLIIATDRIVYVTLLWTVSYPAYLALASEIPAAALIVSPACAIVLVKHVPNFRNLIAGTEPGIRQSLSSRKDGKPDTEE